MGTPTLSVIIATYNRPKSLARLLDNLNRQYNIELSRVEVCVIDDGSDSVFEPAADYNFKFQYRYVDRARDNTARVYGSRNLAVEMTSGEWILQLDDDLEIEDWTLAALQSWAALIGELSPGNKFVLFPRMSNNTDVDTAERGYHRGPDGRWWRGKADFMETHWESSTSAGLFMPRSLFNEIGGYDLAFDGCMGIADRELVLRCQKVGARVFIAPFYVNIADEETGSWRMTMIDRRKRRETNEDLFYAKHPDSKDWTNIP